MYPPHPSGRRPNQHTQLQFANPEQRRASEWFEATRLSQTGRHYYSNQPTSDTGPLSYNQTAPLQMASYPTPTARHAEPTSIRRAGENTSFASSSGASQRTRTQYPPTEHWYCCNSGCPNNGPYNKKLYASCIGCEHKRCLGCRREIWPPVDHILSRSKRPS